MHDPNSIPITVTILTKNSANYLHAVLTPLAAFEEVLVCDTGSQDASMAIARSFPNVSVYERPFSGFGPTHNIASSLAKNDWILSVDSDEVLSDFLVKEICALALTRRTVYSFPRQNMFRGKWIKGCGWHPDRQYRLYNRMDTQFSNAQVHEAIEVQGLRHVLLQAPALHYSYANVSDFLVKMQSYSSLFAAQNQGKKKSSLAKAIAHGCAAFFKSYFLKKGFLDGQEGFEISFYNANTAFYKYLKLAEINDHSKFVEKCGDVLKKTEVD